MRPERHAQKRHRNIAVQVVRFEAHPERGTKTARFRQFTSSPVPKRGTESARRHPEIHPPAVRGVCTDVILLSIFLKTVGAFTIINQIKSRSLRRLGKICKGRQECKRDLYAGILSCIIFHDSMQQSVYVLRHDSLADEHQKHTCDVRQHSFLHGGRFVSQPANEANEQRETYPRRNIF